ncbi:MAG: hypothetical protein WA417_03410, partial [Stellaceae bacterium]
AASTGAIATETAWTKAMRAVMAGSCQSGCDAPQIPVQSGKMRDIAQFAGFSQGVSADWRHFPCPSKRELWSPKRELSPGAGNDISEPEISKCGVAQPRGTGTSCTGVGCAIIVAKFAPVRIPARPRRDTERSRLRIRAIAGLMAGFFVRPFFCAGTARELPCHSRAGRSGLFTFAFVAAG